MMHSLKQQQQKSVRDTVAVFIVGLANQLAGLVVVVVCCNVYRSIQIGFALFFR